MYQTNVLFTNFPSEFLSKEQKAMDSYGLQYAQAIWSSFAANNGANYVSNVNTYEFLEDIANGRQSTNNLSTLLGYGNSNGQTLSTRGIDIQVLNVAKMYVESAISKLKKRQYNFTANIVDPAAVNEHQKKETTIKAFFEVQKSFNTDIAKQLFPELDTSLLEDTLDEALLKIQMSFSQQIALEADVALKLTTTVLNDIEEVRVQIIKDFIVFGIGGTKVYLDENKRPRIRRVNPKNFIFAQVDEQKLDNISYAGEVEFLSVPDFVRESAPYFTDEEQKQIIESYSLPFPYFNFGANYDYNNYNQTSTQYIPVLKFQFLTTDVEVNEIKANKYGNKRIYKKDYNYNPSKEYKQKHPTREVVTTRVINKYGGCYIVNSERVYAYRCLEGPAYNLVDKKLDYNMYAPNINKGRTTSMVAQMVEPLNMVNLCWNRIKETIGLGREGVLDIDLSQLAEISLGGTAVDPKDLLGLLNRDKILIRQSKNVSGEQTSYNNSAPIKEQQIGLRLADIMNVMSMSLNQIRQLTGVNPGLAEPQKGTGLGQTQIAVEAVNDALGSLYHADYQVMKMTYTAALGMFQIASMYGVQFSGMIDALGDGSIKWWTANNKVAFSDFGLAIEPAPSEMEWQMLYAQFEKALAQGHIDGSDLIALQGYKTFKQAQQMFILKEKKGKREAAAEARANSEMNGQIQQQSIQAQAQADLARIQAEAQAAQQLAQFNHQAKMEQIGLTIQGNIQVAQVNADRNIQVQNSANFGKLTDTELRNRAKAQKDGEQNISNTDTK